MDTNKLPSKELGDWEPEQFEAYGQLLLSKIRQHFEQIRDVPVTSNMHPQELLALLDKPLPEKSQPFEDTLEETWEKVIPQLSHWNHPSFHAYFSTSASFPGILADLLISSLNVNALVWKAAPAASALEKIVLRWMAEMVGYDPQAEGVLVNGASLATFYALAAARDLDVDLEIRTKGTIGRSLPKFRVYTSEQAHSSVDKAAIALGIGTENVVHIPTDEHYRMQVDHLEDAIQQDIAKGYKPIAVIATVGTTATGAADPILPISEICKRYQTWLHIDAAYGGFWNLVPEVQAFAENLQLGDSVVVNPHKCLYAPLEVTALYCRRKGALANTFRLVPEYLQTDRPDGSVDFMDYSLQLGRSFRALKLWWIIESFGREGLANRMSESIRLARWLKSQIDNHPDFESPTSSPFALVSMRYIPQSIQQMLMNSSPQNRETIQQYINQMNEMLLDELNKTRTAYVSHAVIREGYIIRISIGNIRTEEEDIQRLWHTIQDISKRISDKFPSSKLKKLIEN